VICLKSKPELNEQQKRLAREYLTDFNLKQAAIRAGYSEAYAKTHSYRLLENDSFKKYLLELQKDITDKLDLSAETLLKDIIEIRDKCNGKKKVKITVGEDDKELYTFNPKGALTACEQLGKHIGLFEKDNKQKGEQTTIIIQRAE